MTSRKGRPGWLLPSGLILLSFVPVIAGGVRIGQLTFGAPITESNARFFADPAPVVIHIVGATTFAILGAFQFAPRFRGRRPRWHRIAGRIVLPCGLAVAGTGMYMALYYPHPDNTGDLLTAFRLVFGSAMATSLLLGLRAILRRDIAAHRAWMIRGYAIGLGAGTQFFTQAPWVLLVGPLDKQSNAWLSLAGWLINIAVAEWHLRGRPNPLRRNRIRAAAPPAASIAG